MEADSIEMIMGPTPKTRAIRLSAASLLPFASRLGARSRVPVYACLLALMGAAVTDFLHVAFGLAPSWEDALHGQVVAGADVVTTAAVVLRAVIAPRNRLVWRLVAVGFGLYAIGGVLWNCWLQYLPSPPSPSIADAFWLAMYPLLGVALVLSARWSSAREQSGRILLDGLLAGTAVAAVCVAFVVPPLVQASERHHGAVVTDLMYPLADMLTGAVAFAVLSIRGWRLDRKWALLIFAFAAWLLGDCMWALQISDSASTGNSEATLCYLVGCALLAAAAWQPEEAQPADRTTNPSLAAPAILALVSPVILLYDHFSRISDTALAVTWVALLTAIVRVAVGMRDTLLLRDVQRVAMTDDLTGLPNRRMFLMRLREQVDLLERQRGTLTALMLDLDNFKQLNDTLGHDAGDELLRLTGPRLAGAVRTDDTVARLGGDEFAILLPGCDHESARDVAQAVLNSFNEPLEVHGLSLRLTASVGIASFPDDATSADTLLRCADVAMYEAKRSRRGSAHYTPERDANTRDRLKISGELARALERDEIEVMFQPIADSRSGRIVAAEALVRWRKSDGRLHPPSEFLEAAELSGLSRPLTRRVLSLTLSELRGWRSAGHNIDASVNASVADLVDLSFPDEIATMLVEHQLPADALAIEVTESSIVADPQRIGMVLKRLRELGVKVALDDFGTGYSSLTHLRELPIDLVKIDRSFVFHMCDEPADAAIVYATIELAHRLQLRTVAEGVEDDRTWAAINELGGERVQGYGLSRPLEPASFRRLLEDRRGALQDGYLAESQSLPTPESTASGGSIA